MGGAGSCGGVTVGRDGGVACRISGLASRIGNVVDRCGAVEVVVAGLEEEFLGEGGVGDDVDGVGAADVDAAGVAQQSQRVGDAGDAGVEAAGRAGGGADV